MTEQYVSKLCNRMIFVVLSMIFWATTDQTEAAGPRIELRYVGEVEGVEARATLVFEDIRTIVNPPGFHAANPFGWVRQYPLTGLIYVAGQITTPFTSYGLTTEVIGTSDFGYGDAFRLDAFERFRIRLDFPADQYFVYLDRFALVPNPISDGTSRYLFTLEAGPDTPADHGGGRAQPNPPPLAEVSVEEKFAELFDRWTTLVETLNAELDEGQRRSKIAKAYKKTLTGIAKGEKRLASGDLSAVFASLGPLYKMSEKNNLEELDVGFENARDLMVAHVGGVIEDLDVVINFRKQNSMKVSRKVDITLERANMDLTSLRRAALSAATFTGIGKIERKLRKLTTLVNR